MNSGTIRDDDNAARRDAGTREPGWGFQTGSYSGFPAYGDGGRGVAIQPRFDTHGSQRFPGGEQEHPERIRVQLGQPVHGHQPGLPVISLLGQRDQILGNGYGCSPPRSRATIVCPSLDSYHGVSMTLNRVHVF